MSRRLLIFVLAIALLAAAGATVFGVWHVVVGGLVNGNARAAYFGLGLATVAGAVLAVLILAARRAGLSIRG